MPATLDIVVVALITVGWLAYEHFLDWPRFDRWLLGDPGRARLREYRLTLATQWVMTVLAAYVWLRAGRSWEEIGFRSVEGWRLWVTIGLALLVVVQMVLQVRQFNRSEQARVEARASRNVQALEKILPHNTRELSWFLLLGVTAGICEEFLFRGYLLSVLSTWIGWWPAAAAGVIFFGLLHGYQGWRGVLQTAIVGIIMTAIVAVTHSLVPAMLLHALVDIQGGVATWSILRERSGESSYLSDDRVL